MGPLPWRRINQFSAASDPDGTLFVCGELFNPGAKRWLTRRSIDQGLTWETVDSPEFSVMGVFPSAGDIKVAPSGEVYAVGPRAVAMFRGNGSSAGVRNMETSELGTPWLPSALSA